MHTQSGQQVSAEQYILAIDLGTSGPKVALYTPAGELVDSVFEKIGLILLPGGGVEQDPADWRSAICRGVQRLLERRPQAAQAVIGIGCTSQWSGTVAVDREGRPLMNAIIWMDARGAPYAQQVTGGLFQVDGFRLDKLATSVRISGGILSPAGKEPTAHILYIKSELPDIYSQTYKFLEPKDYLNLWLTGQSAASYDSIALHWLTDIRDLSRMDYHAKLLRLAGIERDKLPELKRAVDVLGVLSPAAARELGLPAGVPVVMGTPDIHSAALGAGAIADGQAYLYIGTSNWIACHVPYKKTDVLGRMASLPSAIPDRYILSNEQQLAGGCIGYLWSNLFGPQDELACPEAPPDVYSVFERLAESVAPGSNGLIFTPWLNGERTPIDDHLARGGFFNMSLQSTRAHLVRSVYEGVAYNVRWLLGGVEKFLGQRLDKIRITGGGANSALWCQIFADVIDRPVQQVIEPRQVNTRGAALLASVALGHLKFTELSAHVPVQQEFVPAPANRKVYDTLYNEYLGIYKRNRRAYARLNRS